MEDRLRSVVARLREFFPARRRLMLAGCFVAGVFLLFLLASNPGRPPAHPITHPFAPNHGSQNGEILPPDGVRSTGLDGKVANIPAPLGMSSEF